MGTEVAGDGLSSWLGLLLVAELPVDKAMELKYVGGVYSGIVKPTPFLCLVLKMLQIQPEKEIVVEFIKNEEFKYARRAFWWLYSSAAVALAHGFAALCDSLPVAWLHKLIRLRPEGTCGPHVSGWYARLPSGSIR